MSTGFLQSYRRKPPLLAAGDPGPSQAQRQLAVAALPTHRFHSTSATPARRFANRAATNR